MTMPRPKDVIRLLHHFNTHSGCSAHSTLSSASSSSVSPLSSSSPPHLFRHQHQHQHQHHPQHNHTQSTVFSSSYSSSSAAAAQQLQAQAAMHNHDTQSTDYAFEFKSSNLRFGAGVTAEVGADLRNMGIDRGVCVVTDPIMVDLPPMQETLASLTAHGVQFEVYDKVRVEPTDTSFMHAIDFVNHHNNRESVSAFVAVGGGSTIDTAKVANLYSVHRDAEFYDFVNAPIGKGLPVPGALKPLIAIPTTTGTGSETTGVAVFDIESMGCKTGIASRLMTPSLALIDPRHAQHQPNGVVAASGFDVLCHALESFTAIRFDERRPRPTNPKHRPSYQGSNPISDVWCRIALPLLQRYFIRAATDMGDYEARANMQYASCYAGMGFGTAGVHLCHGLSYPISGLNNHRSYVYRDYERVGHAILPHGVSVVVTAPSVFDFTVAAKPELHREAAVMLGAEERTLKLLDAQHIGQRLRERLLFFMAELQIPMGLRHCGFDDSDIDALVQGTVPQERVTKLSPNPVDVDILGQLFQNSMAY